MRYALSNRQRPKPGVSSPCERGSTSIVMAGVLAGVVGLLLGVSAVASALYSAELARAVADQAALAGGARVLAAPSGADDPCASVRAVAAANDASVVGCQVGDTWVQADVSVRTQWGYEAVGRARAGAPEATTPVMDATPGVTRDE